MAGTIARNMAVLMGSASLMVAMAGMAAAQDTNVAERQDRVTLLQRLVVGAGVEKVAIDTPQAVTVVEQEDIDREQASTVGELFTLVPGATMSGSDRQLGQSFNIRGIGGPETAGDQGRIIVTVDGVTKFFEQYRMGGFFSDPELYKRVEVLRGPASSTLYGAGALGGVINFTSKDASDFLDPDEKMALRLKSTYDSNPDGILGSAIFALRPNDQFEFLAAGNYRHAGTYTTGNGTEVPGSEIDAPTGLLKGTFRFGDNNEQVLRASYQQFYTNADDQFYNQTDQTFFGTVDREVWDKTAIIAYENPATDNDWIDLRIQASYSDTVVDQYNSSLIPTLNKKYGYETYEFQIDNTVEFAGDRFQNFLTVGSQSSFQERTNLRLAPSGTHPQGSRIATGAFVQNEFIWDESLTLIAGARVDWQEVRPTDIAGAEDQQHIGFSPKLAAHYKFNETFAAFGSIAHTERAPTIDEVFDAGNVNQPLLDLEKANSYEAGLAFSFWDVAQTADALQVKTTGFYSDIEDLITDNGQTARPRYTNTDSARIYGAEVELAYDSDRIFANAAYTYTIGENRTTGTPLNTIAPHEFAATLGARMPEYGVSFGWTGRFVAAQDRVVGTTTTRQPTDSFQLHDVFVSWKPEDGMFENMEASLRLENIFNEQYREFLSGTPGKGRTVKVSLARKFGS